MKIYKLAVVALLGALCMGILSGCTAEEPIAPDQDYGYIQFKLYKAASYEPSNPADDASTKAVVNQLELLSQACKVQVTLEYGNTTIAQTLPVSAASAEAAEYGLRSDKLRVLAGEYSVKLFQLYDANDELLYNGSDDAPQITVIPNGLTTHDLVVNVEPRGKVKFTLVKDVDADFPNAPEVEARSVNRQYTFDEIATFDITVQSGYQTYTFEGLESTFSIHFDEDSTTFGYQTSSLVCDSILSLPAGEYKIASYLTYDANKILLETNENPKEYVFVVEDNKLTEAKPPITLYEADEYIKDGYALYEIWKALNGPKWYGSAEGEVQGSNWDFNKDPDLWCNQPGVQVHSNGRVARLSLGEFGVVGHMPAAIGQLDQMIELYIGTHNDNDGNMAYNYDPSLALDQTAAERSARRMENHKAYLDMIHTAHQVSEPIARAMSIKGIHLPSNALYDRGYTEDQIFNMSTGEQREIVLMDMNFGKKTNGLKSLPAEIGRLTNLEYFFVANGDLTSLPAEMENLVNLTDVEVYNCSEMVEFPMVLAKLPKLTSLNISNNAQWSPEEIRKGFEAFAAGPAANSLQILYARQNNLDELPESFKNMHRIGLLDLAYNKISKLHPLTKEVAPVKTYLDYNMIEEFPVDGDGYFCGTDDIESFSCTHNKLKEFPNIFNAQSEYVASSIDFSFNEISGFPDDFRGVNVETLTLSRNPITSFPKEFGETDSKVSYIILRGCEISEFPEGCFDGKFSNYFVSFDLTYNHITSLPKDFTAEKLPYLYGFDISYNSLAAFPWGPLNCPGLTVYAVRSQRDKDGNRCLREWPTGLYQHVGLRAFYIGSNDLRKIEDTISYMIYYLDISDNPNITFDASEICYYWQAGAYILMYDKTQNIIGCDEMLR